MEHDYRKIKIWEESRKLCSSIYQLTNEFPIEERYGLISQMRRSAVSIPSNISEGSGSGSNPNFSRYLNISIGSLCELETQVYIALDLKYLSKDQLKKIIRDTDKLKRMILSFRKFVRTKTKKRHT